MENEIQKTEQASPNEMIRLAIEGNADLEKLEKLLGLQERYEANEARKVFAADFAAVQESIAAVLKTKHNPQTDSAYAGLDSVIETSKPVYTQHGFSIIFYEGKTEIPENMRVCADVLHKAGHKETYHFDVPLDGVGIKGNANMTKIHGKASSVSYGRRYLLCMIWNIPTQDDDGNGAESAKTTPMPKKPNKHEQDVLDAICKLLAEKTGKAILNDKVGSIFLLENNNYPANMDRVQAAADWVIGLNRESEWTEKTDTTTKPVMTNVMETLDLAFFEFETVYQEYLSDNMVFDKSRFIKQASPNGALPVGKSASEIAKSVRPEDVAIIIEGEQK